MKKYILFNIAIALLTMVSFSACSDDDDKDGGTPVIRYIRPCDVDASDSLLVKAYLGDRIAIIGENLSGVREVYFNDQKAKLNPSFVTSNAIIVSIPSTIPTEKQDIIRFNTSGASVTYDFETLVPVPLVESMTCEYVADGDVAYIQGYYFVHEDENPLKVLFPGNLEAEVLDFNVNNITVKVPEGAQEGPLKVTSVYGTGESALHFRDQRNIILNFNADDYPDYGYYSGWHGGAGIDTENGVNGAYLIFKGKDDEDSKPWMTGEKWDDSRYGYEKWTYLPTDPDFFDATKPERYVLKFEVNIPEAWSSGALQVVFTGAEDVMMNWQNGNGLTYHPTWAGANSYLGDETWPRMLWMPWVDAASGSYQTDGWVTVTIPMTECKYNADGGGAQAKAPGHYSGITLFVNGGGVEGEPCNPIFHIDNVRIVEAK